MNLYTVTSSGDVEVVSNGTRRHTRDVGTTFPSAGEARTSGSSSILTRGRRGWKSPFKSQGLQKPRESKRIPPEVTSKGTSDNKEVALQHVVFLHVIFVNPLLIWLVWISPPAVSWFISADELRSDSRKENQPEEDVSVWRPSTAWFEPYSRVKPWREPLSQRQVLEDRNRQPSFKRSAEPDMELRTKSASPGRAHMSLQVGVIYVLTKHNLQNFHPTQISPKNENSFIIESP